MRILHIKPTHLIFDLCNIDIIQQSGSCPQGVTTCSGKVDLDITSDDATITINQKDSSD